MRRALYRYLLRRIGLACLSLVGICLITFLLIHVAPGDAGSGGPEGALLTKEGVAAQRRIFFLDLPLFFNASPQGVEGRAARLCSSPVDVRVGALVRCGTACLRPLLEKKGACATLSAEQRRGVLRALAREHPTLGLSREGTAGGQAALRRLSPRRLALKASVLGDNPDSERELEALGSAALPVVMEWLLEGNAKSAEAASRVAQRLAGFGSVVGARAGDREERRQQWQEWWFQHRRDYQYLGEDASFWHHFSETRFAKWLWRVSSWNFGYSLSDGRPISAKLAEALPITLLLGFLSMLLAYLVAVPVALHSAAKRGSRLDRLISLLLFGLYSTPSFWMAMLLVMLLGGVGYANLFPIHGLSSPNADQLAALPWFFDRVWHLVLPVFCLGYGSAAVLSRYQRGALLDVLRQDYIRTARAKGISERRVLWRHALPNALLPTITLIGLHLPYLIGGSVIIERIFGIPGMGLLAFESFLQRDYPSIMAVAVLSAALTLLGLLLSDVLYALLDPRIRLQAARPLGGADEA